MIIGTRFNIGDTVYFAYGDQVKEYTITQIEIKPITLDQPPAIRYKCEGTDYYNQYRENQMLDEEKLESTAEAAIGNLISRLKASLEEEHE